nr:hypothetical protein StreXyl84_08610 [Streptomyces sp. Xyl84]
MISIEELFTGTADVTRADPFDWDPLREEAALQEVHLLDCRVSPPTGRAGLLLDMRTALQYDTGNAALLVVRGLHTFRWVEEPLERTLLPFAIMNSVPSVARRQWRMDIGLFPDGELSLSGTAAEFHLLQAAGIPEGLPDYSEHRLDEIRADLPWWDSGCTVLQSSTTSTT